MNLIWILEFLFFLSERGWHLNLHIDVAQYAAPQLFIVMTPTISNYCVQPFIPIRLAVDRNAFALLCHGPKDLRVFTRLIRCGV